MSSANKWNGYDDSPSKTQWYNTNKLYDNDNSQTQWYNTNKWNDIDNSITKTQWSSTKDNSIGRNQWDSKVDKTQWYNYNNWESNSDKSKPHQFISNTYQQDTYLNSNTQPSVSSSYTVDNVNIADSYFPLRDSYESSGGPYPNSVSQSYFKPSIEYPYEESIKPNDVNGTNSTQESTNNSTIGIIKPSNLTEGMENKTGTVQNTIVNNSSATLDQLDLTDITSSTNDTSAKNNTINSTNTAILNLQKPQNDVVTTSTITKPVAQLVSRVNQNLPNSQSQSGNQNVPIQIISRNRIEPNEDFIVRENTTNQLKLMKVNESQLQNDRVETQINNVTIHMNKLVESNKTNVTETDRKIQEKNNKKNFSIESNENTQKTITQDWENKNTGIITMKIISTELDDANRKHYVNLSTHKPIAQTSFVTQRPVEKIHGEKHVDIKDVRLTGDKRIDNLQENETIEIDDVLPKNRTMPTTLFVNFGKENIPVTENPNSNINTNNQKSQKYSIPVITDEVKLNSNNQSIKYNNTSHILKNTNDIILPIDTKNVGHQFVSSSTMNTQSNDNSITGKSTDNNEFFEFNTIRASDEKDNYNIQDMKLPEFKEEIHKIDNTADKVFSTTDASVKEFQIKLDNFLEKYMMKKKHQIANLIDDKTVVVPSKESNYVDVIPISKYKSSINEQNSTNKFGIKQSYSTVYVYPSSKTKYSHIGNMVALSLNKSSEL